MLIRDLRNAFGLPTVDERDVYRLAGELTVHPAFARVLIARGISDAGTANAFLNPMAADLGDPADFPGVAEAADRILSAIDAGLRVFIAGDFDVDGLTGTAILVRTIRALGGEADYHIPNRLEEGYDLSDGTVRLADERRARLLVTVDCGTRAIESVALAKELGLDVVVTDHHRPADERPDALVVNPHDLADGHQAKNLSGAGIAYKVAAQMLKSRATGLLAEEDLLPLVALGTVCDVVPLVGENRTLARLGIEDFQRTSLVGLQALIDVAGITDVKINSWHLGFILGPRLNAAGRLGRPDVAAELLITDDVRTAYTAASRLEEFNIMRRELENKILGAVTSTLGPEPPADRMAIVVSDDDWHAGVIGIVASRVAEIYNRPTVLVSFSGDSGRGSCRSVPAFDIHTALEETDEFLVRFGGHRQAAGFEIKRDDYDEFRMAFTEYADRTLTQEDLVSELRTDAWMSLAEAGPSVCKDFALLEPTGTGNPPPDIVSLAHVNPESRRVFKNEHLGFAAGLGPVNVRAIGFRMADVEDFGDEPGYYILSYTPNLDTWGGTEKMELRINAIESIEPPTRNLLIVDRRDAPPDETIAANCGHGTAVFSYSTSAAVFPDAVTIINEINAPDAGERFDKLILYAPPFSFSLLDVLLLLVNDGGELIFAYGDSQVEDAREALVAAYPGKELLGKIYRAFEQTKSIAEIGRLFHPAAAARAVEVFRELGLIGIDDDIVVINKRDDVSRLETSPTYNRCARLRAAGLDFIKKLSVWPGEQLDELVFSAINLDRVTDAS
jgi:single-stranded-DNA-specific exonuclease